MQRMLLLAVVLGAVPMLADASDGEPVATYQYDFRPLAEEVAFRFGSKAIGPLQDIRQDVRWLTVVRYANGAQHVVFSGDRPSVDEPAGQFAVGGAPALFYGLSWPSGSQRMVRSIVGSEWRFSDDSSAILLIGAGDTLTFGSTGIGSETSVTEVRTRSIEEPMLDQFFREVVAAIGRSRDGQRTAVEPMRIARSGSSIYSADAPPRILKSFAVHVSFPQPFMAGHGMNTAVVQAGVSFFRVGRMRLPVLSAGLGTVTVTGFPGETAEVFLFSAGATFRLDDWDDGRFELNLEGGYTRDMTNQRGGMTAGLALGF